MSVAVLSRLPLEAVDQAAPSAPPPRMLQLDGIRGLAVAGVLAWHWLPTYEYLRYSPLGWICVRVFFTLSGFLITGILLRARRDQEAVGGAWWGPVRHFYLRRVVRIFPIYYLVLVVVAVAGVQSARENLAWHAFYLSNVVSAARWAGGSTSHFWSLAVEEQFYLIWPWVILFLSRRTFPWILGGMLLSAPVYRLIVFALTRKFEPAAVLPFGCLDSLGAGALLAWVTTEWPERREALARWCLRIGVPLLVLGHALYVNDNEGLGWLVVMDSGVALTTAWLLSRASTGFGGPVGRFLRWGPLIWLGTISYCVYIIHPFVHNVTTYAFEQWGWAEPRLRYKLVMDTALTLVVATASWTCFERPLIRLGRMLAPDRAAPPPRVRPAAATAPGEAVGKTRGEGSGRR